MTEQKSVIRFRNYKPADAGLVSAGLAVVLPQPVLPSAAVKDAEKAELARLLAAPVEAAAASLPKKAHWDLKRDIASRLDKLDRQTQRAIAEIVRERVRTQAELPPPAAAVPALGVPAVAASGSGRGGATAAGASGSGAAAGADAEFDFSAAGLDPAALVRAVASAEAAASGGGFDDVDVAA